MAAVEQAPDDITVRNPATGAVVATVPAAGPDEVAAMVERARAAQPSWEAGGFEAGAQGLRRAQQWVARQGERIARTIVEETGKAYEDAHVVEVGYTALMLRYWAGHAAATWPRSACAAAARSSPGAGSWSATARSASSASSGPGT